MFSGFLFLRFCAIYTLASLITTSIGGPYYTCSEGNACYVDCSDTFSFDCSGGTIFGGTSSSLTVICDSSTLSNAEEKCSALTVYCPLYDSNDASFCNITCLGYFKECTSLDVITNYANEVTLNCKAGENANACTKAS